jgi:hypothetical protein
MPPNPLPSEGPEREIFLIALQQFSERCDAPNLIAACPFSVDLPTGGRGCGEECEKLLDTHGRPSTSARVSLDSSSGFAIERSKRRGVAAELPVFAADRAFDAMEIFWRDQDTPLFSNWHSVALLMAVKETIYTVPSARFPGWDQVRVMGALQELERRGYSADKLVRYGLASKIMSTITGAVGVHLVLGDISKELGDRVPEASDPVVARWFEFCMDAAPSGAVASHSKRHRIRIERIESTGAELLSDKTTNELELVLTRLPELLKRWVADASLGDLIDWSAPAEATLEAHAVAESGADALTEQDRQICQWIWDRFTGTYLADWLPSSLQLEWKHFRRRITAPLDEREMSIRFIEPAELSALVADTKTASGSGNEASRQMVASAVRLIKDGHRRAAATLFGAVLAIDFEDGQLYNNYGFCLLPDNAQAGYAALEKACSMGYGESVNLANRILALYWMDKPAMALELAHEHLSNWEKLDGARSYLWDFRSGRDEPRMLDRVSPRDYVVRLAVHIASETGDEVLLARWSKIADRYRVH